ncbi:hypothetical protein GCM10010517_70430 [Streptosporangium fragile]|uniref:Uncharacterized protein n=1 Tax=Streptosporangium fragile TaxID=46186 RepID=A0ABN3W8F5_9ACTN
MAGACVGTPDEIVIADPVAEVSEKVKGARAEARARKGWIMDSYLLRRRRRTAVDVLSGVPRSADPTASATITSAGGRS